MPQMTIEELYPIKGQKQKDSVSSLGGIVPSPGTIEELYPIGQSKQDISGTLKPYGLKQEPDVIDQTLGAFAYGAADLAEKLAKFVGLDSVGKDLADFKINHPQYAPEEVDSAWDLITNPRALAGRVFGSAPQLLLTAGSYAVGGPLLAGALSYGIESQRAYDGAKASGASEDEAKTAGRVQGIINAAWNVLPVHKIFRFARGAEEAVQAKALATALGTIKQTGATGQTLKFIATQSLFGVLQGSSNELLENQIYGKEIPKGWLDRRLQEAVGAGVAGAVFGLSARYLNTLKVEGERVWVNDPKTGKKRAILSANELMDNLFPTELGQKFKDTITTPDTPSVSDLVPMKEYPKQIASSHPSDLSFASRAKDAVKKLFSPILPMWMKMRDGPVRDNLLENMNTMGYYRGQRLGQYTERLYDLTKKAQDNGSLEMLHQEKAIPSNGGSANFETMYLMNDPRGVPPELRVSDVKNELLDLFEEARVKEGEEAVLANVTRERGDWRNGKGKGTAEPFYPSRDPHLPRIPTEEFWDIAQGRAPQEDIDFVNGVLYDLNKRTFKSVSEISDILHRDYGESDPNRIVGITEKGRDIPIMPSSVTTPSGKRIQLLNTDTTHMFISSVGHSALKTAQARLIGQGMLKTVTDRHLKDATDLYGVTPEINNGFLVGEMLSKNVPLELIKTYKVSPTRKDLIKNILEETRKQLPDATSKMSDSLLTQLASRSISGLQRGLKEVFDPIRQGERIRGVEKFSGLSDVQSQEAGVVEKMIDIAKSMKTERRRIPALAQSLGIETRLNRDYMLRALENVDANNLTDKQVKGTRELARKVGGINLNLNTPELLQSLKDRLSQDVVRRGWEPFLEEYRASGHDPKDALAMIKLFNGIPLSRLGSSLGANIVRLASSTIGAMQTSTSAIPNLFQPLLSTQFVGEKRMYQAINKVLTDPSTVRSEQLSFGAVLPTLFTASREGSSAIRKLSDNIREGAASLSATRWANERANLMTGEAAKLMAQDWKENGIPRAERWKIKELGLTKDEVVEIDSGNMRDFTYRKVIQASVAKSQYNMEFAWNKAPLENSPIGRMIFAYNSYMLGQTRSAINFASHAWEFMKSPTKLASAEGYGLIKRIVTLGITSVGAGMMSQMLRQAIRGNLSQQVNEDQFTRMSNAFIEVQSLGVAQRMMDSFTYDQGSLEKTFIGTMPQISFATQFLGTLLGYGRYGKFSLDERLWESVKKGTPVVRGIDSFINQIAYPELSNYKSTKDASSKFEREVIRQGSSPPGEDQFDPKYYRIYQDVARDDLESAREKSRALYMDALKNGEDVRTVIKNLRSSLMGRSPIPLNDVHTVQFLMSQAKDRRVAHVRNYLRYTSLVDQIAPSGI